jgi:hypothetical protein
MNNRRNNDRDHEKSPCIPYRLPPARPARADFHLLRSRHYVLLVPASTRGDWFLSHTPLADPPQLIPRIGPARLLLPQYAAALLPALAEHFRLRHCHTQRTTPSPHAP